MAGTGADGRPIRVLVLGGGFGGVAVAQELERLVPKSARPTDVTLVSQNNYLLFVPMLAEAAAASIGLTHILSPLRELLPRTRIRVECVDSIDLAGQTVTRDHAPRDHLVARAPPRAYLALPRHAPDQDDRRRGPDPQSGAGDARGGGEHD